MIEKLAVPENHQLPNPMGRDINAGPWQTGATGDGGSTHPDDTLRGALCQNGGLEVPDCWTTVVRHAEKNNPCQPWISNDVYPSQCIAINMYVCLHFSS